MYQEHRELLHAMVRDRVAVLDTAPDMLQACESLVTLWEDWAADSGSLQEPLHRSLEMRVEEARRALVRAYATRSCLRRLIPARGPP